MPPSIANITIEKFTTFGDFLRFLRRRAGMTQMELAIAVGYSDAQISRLEQNLRLPYLPNIEASFVPALYLEDDPKAVEWLLNLAANVRREDAPVLGLCPYKGLNYFEEADADLFVGRELLTSMLVERVIAYSKIGSPKDTRFLALVGASGSGKSSLVRAGLVPALHWNKISADWMINILTPTSHPLESLALNLTKENSSVVTAARLVDDLARDSRSLHLFAKREVMSSKGTRLLLVVDQFEELFTLCNSEEERNSFIDNLLNAASESDGPTIVVITIRADFYAHCAGYIQLREAVAHQQEYIGSMNMDELRRAIEEPARRGRWELEPGLVELLLRDVGSEPGALPLLSHALLETWQRRRGRMMTLSGYTSSGGVRGAIAETAEAVFADQFTHEQKIIARRIFLRLTKLGDETSTGDTRRRATFEELILRPEDATLIESVLRALADARLIITREDSAEVAHEALIHEWPILRQWLEDDREGLRLHRQLTDAAQDWAIQERQADLLYRGARLSQACEWALNHQDELNALEREFLEASQTLAERETIEREEQRQRELESAQKLVEVEGRRAEEQAHAAQQLRKNSVYLASALIIAVILALLGGFLGWQARAASLRASSRELAAASISNLEIDPERSVLLALEAYSKAHTLEAEKALHQSILATRVLRTISADEPGIPMNIELSPDGSNLVTAGQDEIVKIWDIVSGETVFTTYGHFATFSPDGKRLAIITPDGTVKFFSSPTFTEISLPEHIDAGMEVDFSPDGTLLAAVTAGNLPRIWDIETGKEVTNFPGHTDFVSFALFSPDGKHLLTTSDDGTARVWDIASGKELLKLADHPGWVWTAAYSLDGKLIATVSENQAVIWDAATGEKLHLLMGQMDNIQAVEFSPDGSRLATGGLDRMVKIWDVATGNALFSLVGHTGSISSLAFSHDGTRLMSASEDGTIKIWDLNPSREWVTINSPESVNQIAFSTDGALLMGGESDRMTIWDAGTGKELRQLTGYKEKILAIAVSADDKHLVATSDGPDVKIWNGSMENKHYTWPAHTGRVNSLTFSPDGKRLATAGDDYKVKIWDISADSNTGKITANLSLAFDLPSEVKSLSINSDGSKLAAGTGNGIVNIWDMNTGRVLLNYWGHTDVITGIAFSPDDRYLATASLDGTAKVWNVITEKESLAIHGHISAITAVVFSPDGRSIATASRDGTAKLWNAETGQEMLTLYGDGSGLNSIVFSPDGSRLATGGDTGVHTYLMKTEDLVAMARSRVTRGLTSDECQMYLHHISAACTQPNVIPTTTPLPPATYGRICQVTNTAGLYDHYFNEAIFKGVQDVSSIYDWEINVLQSISVSDYEKNIRAFMGSHCNLIVAMGNTIEMVGIAAEANPSQKFMITDWVPDQPLENVWTQTYAIDQAAFLAGYLAASVTKTGKVGIFGGVDTPPVTDFMDGFTLGVEYYNRKNGTSVQVLGWDVGRHEGLFTGSFCCTTEGRQMTKKLLDEGADIIVPVAGQSIGWGAGAEIKEHGDAFLIGVDTDWTETFPEFTSILLTSIEKNYAVSVTLVAKSIVDNNFAGGVHVGSLSDAQVGISTFHDLDGLISSKVKTDLEQIRADIIAGKIKTRP